MKLNKRLNNRAFQAIKDGRKKVEISANKARYDQPSFNTATPSDIIEFTNTENGDTMLCQIKQIALYESVKSLLEAEGTRYTLSSTNDINEGIESIQSIPNYKSYIRGNGVFAVHLATPKETLWAQLTALKTIVSEKQNVNEQRNTGSDWSEMPATYLECIRDETVEVEEALDHHEALTEELGDILWDYINLLESLEKDISVQKLVETATAKYESRLKDLKERRSWSDAKSSEK